MFNNSKYIVVPEIDLNDDLLIKSDHYPSRGGIRKTIKPVQYMTGNGSGNKKGILALIEFKNDLSDDAQNGISSGRYRSLNHQQAIEEMGNENWNHLGWFRDGYRNYDFDRIKGYVKKGLVIQALVEVDISVSLMLKNIYFLYNYPGLDQPDGSRYGVFLKRFETISEGVVLDTLYIFNLINEEHFNLINRLKKLRDKFAHKFPKDADKEEVESLLIKVDQAIQSFSDKVLQLSTVI